MREVDTSTLLSGTDGVIYVDSKEACLEESGELIGAGVTEERLIEVGDVFTNGDIKAFVPDGSVVFKCVGMGIIDLAEGRALLDIAKDLGLGNDLEGF